MDRRQAHARHHRLSLLAGAAVLALPGAAYADRPAEEKGVLSLAVENDSLSSGADRNYTSGIKLAYVSPSAGVPDWLEGAGGFTRALSGSNPDFWGISIGQSIFTPEDIEANPAPPDQHPYAGWLYMQIMVGAEEDRSDGRAPRYLDTYELEFGIVGPSALGRQAQSGIHQLLGAPHPNGWDSQLNDEFAFALSFDRRWRALRVFADVVPGGIEADLTPSAGATLGTLRDEARVGLTARIGQRIDNDYGPPRVRPSLAGVEHFSGGPLAWSLFAGVQGRAVAHNLFLDGNTFQDSASVDRNPYVADFQTGFSISAGDWRLAYTYVWRTEEFSTQPTRQDFGALALSWRL
ncbi:MAG: lipid A deacylase LpxR family protein [Hyphomonadaceae bacterium]